MKREEKNKRRRIRAELKRQAAHDSEISARQKRLDDPLVKRVAYVICGCVYPAGCACEKRQDQPACSSMASAALSSIEIIKNGED